LRAIVLHEDHLLANLAEPRVYPEIGLALAFTMLVVLVVFVVVMVFMGFVAFMLFAFAATGTFAA
jgi:hypothetical protein